MFVVRHCSQSGGSLAWLHGGKPFLRGGDFTARQAQGDRPMQLNYSRAFGGKDLKM
jgi:protein phosphatase